MNQELNSITERIIGCAYTVGNILGHGFLEKVYENALSHELSKNGLEVRRQYPIRVTYDGISVGDYFADLCYCLPQMDKMHADAGALSIGPLTWSSANQL